MALKMWLALCMGCGSPMARAVVVVVMEKAARHVNKID